MDFVMRKNKDSVSGRIPSPEFMQEEASTAVTVTTEGRRMWTMMAGGTPHSPFDAR